jgi:hypothetical protein
MKRALAILSLALVACIGPQIAAAQDDPVCSNESLTGRYGFVLTGTIIGLGPISIIGTIEYDGSGNLVRRERAVVNGHPLPPETNQGMYTVNQDCTGSASDSLGHHSFFVIVNHGKTVHEEGTDPGSVITITIEKQ